MRQNQRAVRTTRLGRASLGCPTVVRRVSVMRPCRAGVAGTLFPRKDSVKLKNLSYNIATEAKKSPKFAPSSVRGRGLCYNYKKENDSEGAIAPSGMGGTHIHIHTEPFDPV